MALPTRCGDELANPKDVDKIVKAARQFHGGLSAFLDVAEKSLSLRDQYVEKHWGKEPAGKLTDEPLPNVQRGLVKLGELVSVVYVTEKGRDHELVEYEHTFSDHLTEGARDGTRPILCFAPDGSGLVIVRGRSKYAVKNRGIVG